MSPTLAGRQLPVPRTPRSVQTLNWVARPYPYLRACQRRFGDVFLLRVHTLGDVVMLCRPDHVADAFRLTPDEGRTGEANQLMAPVLGDQSLFIVDGEVHRRRRKEVKGVITNRPPVEPDVVRRLTLEELPPDGGALEANELFRWLAMRLIGHRVLGTAEPEVLRPLAAKMRWVTGPLSSLAAFFPVLQRDRGPLTPGHWFQRQLRALDATLTTSIAESSRRCPHAGVGAELSDGRGQTWGDPPDAALRDDLITLIAAGDDTVASALAWALFWIVRSPEVQRRLLNDPDGIPVEASSEEMLASQYLEAACLESLRISPVVDIVSRKTTVPLVVGGYDVPVGSVISPAVYLSHHNPAVFEDPEAFRPERFIDRQYSPYEYYPFGGGGRRCIGAALALFEMRIVIGTILAHFEVVPETTRSTELRSARRNVTVAPAGPLRFRLVRRR